MSTLKFTDMDRIRTLIDHAMASTEWQMGYEEDLTPQPAFYFVHDQGIYLMSNGVPRMPHEDRGNVCYADGFDPSKVEFDDWYEAARDAVGGDDFAEVLPLQPNLLPIPDGAVAFVIKLTTRTMTCGWDVKTTRGKVKA